MQKLTEEAKMRIVRQHIENGRSAASLAQEYGVGRSSLLKWVKQYREECQSDTLKQNENNMWEENRRLRKELEELEKENRFLKKAAAFFAREIE